MRDYAIETSPATTILCLVFTGSPAAILRMIRTIIIDAFDCVLYRWTEAHISQEMFKGMPPSSAYHNSASAIDRIGLVSRIVAPLFHRAPNVPLTDDCALSGITMSTSMFPSTFVAKTSTTNTATISQSGAVNRALCTTVTAAQPLTGAHILASCPTTEALSTNIVKGRHTSCLPVCRGYVNA